MSKEMDGPLKLAHKVADVDRANRKICVTLLRYNVDKAESSYAQVRLCARKKEDEKFQQVVCVNKKLEEFLYLLDVMNSVYNKVVTNQPIFNVFLKSNSICLLFIMIFLIESRWVGTLEIIETSFSN